MMLLTIIFCFFILLIFVFFKKFSSLVNTYDVPNERKLHKEKVSLAGGVYIFICIYFYLIFALILHISDTEIFFDITTVYLNFFIVSLIFFLIGFFDDKKNLSPNIKIIFFFILILSLVSIDPNLNVKLLRFSFIENKILLQNFSVIFTIFSIFIFINALNMYDGSNGQLGIYVMIFILYLSFKSGLLIILNLVLPIIFFIYLNIKNITFAGNAGSYFLGFLLSYIVLKTYNNQEDFLTSDEIVLMMFYPVLDLVRLFFYRIINNKSPFSADRNHIHHILQEKNYNNKQIQLILGSIIVLPMIIYEFTKVNIILIFLLNTFLYYIIISKNFIFSK